ncbi:hypothetical protein NKR23_g2474 [Pleurostoma richardsiae]|uniref:Uncharacterized protein n=1 Tax=Pleurostoma richardsiae TaxID=41990 RepID=A0AA38S2I6_9PEZI|nr:hypothetical protein NKR23_g2474 [Pleurostoma richardsiae]
MSPAQSSPALVKYLGCRGEHAYIRLPLSFAPSADCGYGGLATATFVFGRCPRCCHSVPAPCCGKPWPSAAADGAEAASCDCGGLRVYRGLSLCDHSVWTEEKVGEATAAAAAEGKDEVSFHFCFDEDDYHFPGLLEGKEDDGRVALLEWWKLLTEMEGIVSRCRGADEEQQSLGI